ncbi:RGCVC family protein [Blastococcus saxobsidens]|uniref:RGCVC family protein n=1 Tax=Blastococcus saxobsidens TaxID=138336 RepID=UPI001954FD67|nr:RGCVC family protein [Blastococcus saxobsidens]
MTSAPSAVIPASSAEATCEVCPHALADHDRISLRFCQATQAQLAGGAAAHGCVCPA